MTPAATVINTPEAQTSALETAETWDEALGLETNGEDSALAELPPLDAGPRVRRVVEVPDNGRRSVYENIDEIEDSELDAFSRHNLAEALAGDVNSANRVVHAQRRCRGAPESSAAIEFEVERAMQRYAWLAENRNRNRTYPSEQEVRERSTARFENCRYQSQLFTGSLREQLESMANRGHVAARYLYALWPPEIFGRPDAFLQHQEWSEKALGYTIANLTEGEAAGLLAFGQSYANNGMFTATNRFLGTAFIIAAIDCGLDLAYYSNYVDNFLSSDRYADAFRDPRPEVLQMADGLKAFCS